MLITGASGLVGEKLIQQALARGHEVYSSYKDHPITTGKPLLLNITDEGQVLKTIGKIRPEAIINSAAVSDVDYCQEHPEIALKINAESVSYLAKAARENNGFLVQVSTDYVFDGDKGDYSEADPAHPVNSYGLTKLQGEHEAMKAGEDNYCIARPSVIYGWGRTYRPNAATYPLEKLGKNEMVKMVSDQYCSPTLDTNLADMLVEIAERKISGRLHTAGANRLSRYEFAQKLSYSFNLDANLIQPTEVQNISWKAKRPKDSSLDVTKAHRILVVKPLPIDEALRQFKLDRDTTNSESKL